MDFCLHLWRGVWGLASWLGRPNVKRPLLRLCMYHHHNPIIITTQSSSIHKTMFSHLFFKKLKIILFGKKYWPNYIPKVSNDLKLICTIFVEYHEIEFNSIEIIRPFEFNPSPTTMDCILHKSRHSSMF